MSPINDPWLDGPEPAEKAPADDFPLSVKDINRMKGIAAKAYNGSTQKSDVGPEPGAGGGSPASGHYLISTSNLPPHTHAFQPPATAAGFNHTDIRKVALEMAVRVAAGYIDQQAILCTAREFEKYLKNG